MRVIEIKALAFYTLTPTLSPSQGRGGNKHRNLSYESLLPTGKTP